MSSNSRLRGYEGMNLAPHSGARSVFDTSDLAYEGRVARERPETAFGQGLRSSMASMEAGRYAKERLAAEQAGDLARAQELATLQESALRRAGEMAPRVQSHVDIEGIGDALNFAGGAVGQMVPTTLPSLAAGIGAAALTRGRARLPASYTASAAPAYPLERGQAVLEQYEDPVIAAKPADERARAADLRGLAGAAVEGVLPAVIARGITTRAPLRRAVLEGAATGAPTEGAQALMSQYHRSYFNPERDRSGDRVETIDAILAGLVGGAGLGGGVVGGAQVAGAALSRGTELAGEGLDALSERMEARRQERAKGIRGDSLTEDVAQRAAEAADEPPQTVREAIDRVLGGDETSAVESLTMGDSSPALVKAIRQTEPGSPEELSVIQRFEQNNAENAVRLARRMLDDETVSPEIKQRLEGLVERASERGAQAAVAAEFVRHQSRNAAARAADTIKNLTARLTRRTARRNELSDAADRGATTERFSRMAGLTSSERAVIIQAVLPHLTPEARATTGLIDSLPELVAAVNQMVTRPDGRLTRDDLNDIALMRDSMDIFTDPEAALKVIADAGKNLRREGRNSPLLEQFAKFTKAEQDATNQNSFFWAMLSDEALDLTPSQLKAAGRLVDDFTMHDTDDATGSRILDALAPLFGSRERAAQVIDVYQEQRAPSILDEESFLDPDSDLYVTDDSGSDLEQARERGRMEGFQETGPAVSPEDVMNLAAYFGWPAARRPELVSSAAARKQLERALKFDANARMINYGDYLAQLHAGEQADSATFESRLSAEYKRLLGDIRQRLEGHKRRDKQSMEKRLSWLEGHIRERKEIPADQRSGNHSEVLRALEAEARGIRERLPNAEDRSEIIKRLTAEGRSLVNAYNRNGYQQALNRYEIVLADIADTQADDNQIAGFRTLLDQKVNPNTYRGGKAAAEAINREIDATKIRILTDKGEMVLSAESMWKTAGDRIGHHADETQRQRAARLFAEALGAVLYRPDVQGIAENGLTDSTVIDRKTNLTYGDVRQIAYAKGVDGIKPSDLAEARQKQLNKEVFKAEIEHENLADLRKINEDAWQKAKASKGVFKAATESEFKLHRMNEVALTLVKLLDRYSDADLSDPTIKKTVQKIRNRLHALREESRRYIEKLLPIPDEDTRAGLGGETTDVFPQADYFRGLAKREQAEAYRDRALMTDVPALQEEYSNQATRLEAEAMELIGEKPRFYEEDTGLPVRSERRNSKARKDFPGAESDAEAVQLDYVSKDQVNSDFSWAVHQMTETQLQREINRRENMLDSESHENNKNFANLLRNEIEMAQEEMARRAETRRESAKPKRPHASRIQILENEFKGLTKKSPRREELKAELAWEKDLQRRNESPTVMTDGTPVDDSVRAMFRDEYNTYYRRNAREVLGIGEKITQEKLDTLHKMAQDHASKAVRDRERQSAMRAKPGRPRQWTDAERQEIVDLIAKMRGPNVQVVMDRLVSELGGSGKWAYNRETGRRFIGIAVNAADPRGAAFHESMHDFFNMLLESPGTRAIARDIRSVANSPMVIRQLRELLANHPEALAQIEYPSAKEAAGLRSEEISRMRQRVDEERLAYAFQFWMNGAIELRQTHDGFFQKIARFLRNLMGTLSEAEQFEHVMTALARGDLQNPSTVTQVLADQGALTTTQRLENMSGIFGEVFRKVFMTSTDNLRRTGIPPLETIADMFYQEAGHESGGRLPFIQRRSQQMGIFINRLWSVLEGTSSAERVEIARNLQSMKEPTTEKEIQIKALLDEAFAYMQEAGVKRFDGETREWNPLMPVRNYFPRHWDRAAVQNRKGQFIKLLMEEGRLDRSQAEASFKAIVQGNGQIDLAETDHHIGFTPFNSAVLDRQFTFITPENAEEFAEFQSKDLGDIMTTYLYQATHRAEYARDFGNNGERIKELLEEAREYGASPQEIEQAIKNIRGLEGTIGHDMSVKTKEMVGAVMTFQNLVLLPLSIFAQMVDPLNITVRTGDFRDAGRAYMRAVKALSAKAKEAFTKQKVADPDQELAIMLGIIDRENMLEAMGMVYGNMHMTPFIRDVNRKFFRWNGMEGWNHQMRIAATVAGERFLLANLDNARFMQEIGLTKEDVFTTPDGRLAVSRDQIKEAMVRSKKRYGNVSRDDKAAQAELRIREAMFRFVDSTIIRPGAGQRATWMSDPRFLLVAHLKQFAYSFQSVILRRVRNEALHGNALPAATLIAYVPVMIASDMAKWMTVGGGIPSSIDSVGALLQHGIMRSGILGKFEFGFEAVGDAARGRVPGFSFIGPTGEHASMLAQWAAGGPVSTERVLDRTIPGYRYF